MRLIIFTLLSFFAFGNLDAELQQKLKKTNVVLNEALEGALIGDSKRSISQNAADLNSELRQQNRALKKALEGLKSLNEESVGAIYGGSLYPGQMISTNNKLWSPNHNCYLKMQKDGNLVLYRDWDTKAFWSTETNGNGNGYNAYFQNDGNFLVRKGVKVRWATDVYNQGATELKLQDDGNIVVYRYGQALWESKTYGWRACDTGAFDIVMASDPQYSYTDCKNPSTTGTSNYALADKKWCQDRGDFWRTNNLMNGIWDSLGEERLLTGKPIGANIIGDLTNTASEGQEKAFARKVHDIEHDGGNNRIWQSMGNHDLNAGYGYKDIKEMARRARNLVTENGPGSYHDKGSFNKWHDGFCGDPESASYVYKKNGVAFINLQLAPNAKFVRVQKHSHGEGLTGPSGWLMNLLDGKNNHCFSFNGVKGVFLMHHYPRFCSGNTPPTDCPRWNEVKDAITRFNNDAAKPRVMASFVGHYHEYSGYSHYSKLHKLPGNVHRFYCGGLEFDTYLDVEVYPDGSDPYYLVYSNAVDPNKGTPNDKFATGFVRKCINKNGRHHPKCTRWNFDGTVCDHNPSNPSACPIKQNPRV